MSALPREDVPESLAEFLDRFGTEAKCAKFMRRWRYPRGFRCPACGHDDAWYIETRQLDECARCHRQTSLTAGTVMHRSPKPLRLWFLAMYLFVVSKQGISSMSLARQLGVSYPTAWLWLHKLRSALGMRTLELLQGVVEVDETYEVGFRHGSGGGRPSVSAKASLIVGAIEVAQDRKGFGRVRLASLSAATAPEIGAFVQDTVAPGATLLTDGWRSYRALGASYDHVPVAVTRSGRKAHECLPGIHRVFALLDRVLKGTYQGAVRQKHLGAYLEEFAFRFNRRMSTSRSLLFQRALSAGVIASPPTYWELIGRRNPRASPEPT
jgi:transposase-like protein